MMEQWHTFDPRPKLTQHVLTLEELLDPDNIELPVFHFMHGDEEDLVYFRRKMWQLPRIMQDQGYLDDIPEEEMAYYYEEIYGEEPPSSYTRLQIYIATVNLNDLKYDLAHMLTRNARDTDREFVADFLLDTRDPTDYLDCRGSNPRLWQKPLFVEDYTFERQYNTRLYIDRKKKGPYFLSGRDPVNNFGIVFEQGTSRRWWVCCGLPEKHPGCWKGAKLDELQKLDLFAGQTEDIEAYLKAVISGKRNRLREMWLAKQPVPPTRWKDFEWYENLEEEIYRLKEENADLVAEYLGSRFAGEMPEDLEKIVRKLYQYNEVFCERLDAVDDLSRFIDQNLFLRARVEEELAKGVDIGNGALLESRYFASLETREDFGMMRTEIERLRDEEMEGEDPKNVEALIDYLQKVDDGFALMDVRWNLPAWSQAVDLANVDSYRKFLKVKTQEAVRVLADLYAAQNIFVESVNGDVAEMIEMLRDDDVLSKKKLSTAILTKTPRVKMSIANVTSDIQNAETLVREMKEAARLQSEKEMTESYAQLDIWTSYIQAKLDLEYATQQINASPLQEKNRDPDLEAAKKLRNQLRQQVQNFYQIFRNEYDPLSRSVVARSDYLKPLQEYSLEVQDELRADEAKWGKLADTLSDTETLFSARPDLNAQLVILAEAGKRYLEEKAKKERLRREEEALRRQRERTEREEREKRRRLEEAEKRKARERLAKQKEAERKRLEEARKQKLLEAQKERAQKERAKQKPLEEQRRRAQKEKPQGQAPLGWDSAYVTQVIKPRLKEDFAGYITEVGLDQSPYFAGISVKDSALTKAMRDDDFRMQAFAYFVFLAIDWKRSPKEIRKALAAAQPEYVTLVMEEKPAGQLPFGRDIKNVEYIKMALKKDFAAYVIQAGLSKLSYFAGMSVKDSALTKAMRDDDFRMQAFAYFFYLLENEGSSEEIRKALAAAQPEYEIVAFSTAKDCILELTKQLREIMIYGVQEKYAIKEEDAPLQPLEKCFKALVGSIDDEDVKKLIDNNIGGLYENGQWATGVTSAWTEGKIGLEQDQDTEFVVIPADIERKEAEGLFGAFTSAFVNTAVVKSTPQRLPLARFVAYLLYIAIIKENKPSLDRIEDTLDELEDADDVDSLVQIINDSQRVATRNEVNTILYVNPNTLKTPISKELRKIFLGEASPAKLENVFDEAGDMFPAARFPLIDPESDLWKPGEEMRLQAYIYALIRVAEDGGVTTTNDKAVRKAMAYANIGEY